MMSVKEIRRALRFIATSYTTRCLTFEHVRNILGITASVRTIRRELCKIGYRRCVSCPRPFISGEQAKKRLSFARVQGGGDWRKVTFPDECTWETGRKRRTWVTRRTDEKECSTCIRSVYWSGRFTVMIWGVIGWDYKSPLIFLEKLPDRKGVYSKAYLEQGLEPVVFPLFHTFGLEYIFIEDGSKVYKGKAKLPRLLYRIRGFSWPPSS
jgi:hypothetical protein